MQNAKQWQRFGTTLIWGMLCAFGVIAACSSQDPAPQEQDTSTDIPLDGTSARMSVDLSGLVNQELGLRESTIAKLIVRPTPGSSLGVSLPIDGQQRALELHPHSVRAAGYDIRVQRADGSYESSEPGQVHTLRGKVSGIEASAVAASLGPDGLYAWISMGDGQRYMVQPVVQVVPGADPDQHVIYHQDDMVASDELIDFVLPNPQGGFDGGGKRQKQTVACGTGLCQAELAVDADFEFYQYWGSSVAAVEDRINAVINMVNLQYELDVDITHVITAIIVRTSEPDPYTSSNASTLLSEFRTQWLNNHADIPRDLAQLFTGKDITYNGSDLIGLAWMNSVCTSYAYSVVQQYGSAGVAADLSAHEMGHSWSAGHCSCANPPYTMNSYITGANEFHPTESIPTIVAFRDSRTCLEGVSNGCGSDAECDDGNTCNGQETCNGGTCQAGTPIDCNDNNGCTTDNCAPATGLCGHASVNCDDNDPCTADGCNPTDGCTHSSSTDCCGDGSCDGSEDCNTCPSDCLIGGGPGCNNGVCEPTAGEDCLSCPADCNGKQSGPPSGRFCCGDGAGQNPLYCGGTIDYPQCTVGDFECGPSPEPSCCGDGLCDGDESSYNCEADCGPPPICGDGACNGGENQCTCAADCGAPASTETSCTDALDNDCDGLIDCADGNCAGNAACPSCGAPGAPCTSNGDCCSNKCKGNGTCR